MIGPSPGYEAGGRALLWAARVAVFALTRFCPAHGGHPLSPGRCGLDVGMIRIPGVGAVRRTGRERVASMQRARRLASTAVVAVLAVSGLSACRSEPGVAAYVGGTTISEARVQQIYDDAETKLAAGLERLRAERAKNPDPTLQPIPDAVQLKLKPENVLQALVGLQVLRGVAQERKVQPTETPAAQVAQQLGLPADVEYVTVYAEYQGYLNALLGAAKPVQLTDPQLREVFQRLRSAGDAGDAGLTYEQFTQEILTPQNSQVLQQSYGLRNDLKDAAQKADIKFNPRYGAQELPLLPVPTEQGGSVSLVSLPFGAQADSSPAVVDLP